MTRKESLIDISISLKPGMISWPGDPQFEQSRLTHDNEDYCVVSRISMCSHTGTHIDAPAHYIKDGITVEGLALETMIGRALVVDLSSVIGEGRKAKAATAIEVEHLKLIELAGIKLTGIKRLLLKTGNSKLYDKKQFTAEYTYLSTGAARYLVEKGVKLIGIDYLSIDGPELKDGPDSNPNDDKNNTHKILLENDIIILETIDLSSVEPGFYELICLPLSIFGCDGAPARALLRTYSE